jgi:glycosyltransferase involved in cell wall biosynthesis
VLSAREGGGNAERTVQMTRALQAGGCTCTVLTLDIGDARSRQADIAGARLIVLPCLNRRFQIPLGGWQTVVDAVREADVIHLKGQWHLLNAIVYLAARRQGLPYVVGPGGALPLFGRSLWFKRLFNMVVGRRIVREASGWIANTSAEFAHFEAYDIPRQKVAVIPNGVWESDFAAGEAAEFHATTGIPGGPLVLFMGRLNPIKGPDLLLEAFARVADQFPAYRLIFAGPDEGMQAALELRATAMGLRDRVNCCGFLGGRLKAAAYRAARLLVVPSRSEAMSIVAVEAGICATPVLMTDQCGLDELHLVSEGLVVQASADGLAAGLRFALADPDRLRAWGSDWQALVRERYLWRRNAGALQALLEQVAQQEPRGRAH